MKTWGEKKKNLFKMKTAPSIHRTLIVMVTFSKAGDR
jgi:hypothetical protein